MILSSYHFMGWMENLVLKENDYYEVKLWKKILIQRVAGGDSGNCTEVSNRLEG